MLLVNGSTCVMLSVFIERARMAVDTEIVDLSNITHVLCRFLNMFNSAIGR